MFHKPCKGALHPPALDAATPPGHEPLLLRRVAAEVCADHDAPMQ